MSRVRATDKFERHMAIREGCGNTLSQVVTNSSVMPEYLLPEVLELEVGDISFCFEGTVAGDTVIPKIGRSARLNFVSYYRIN